MQTCLQGLHSYSALISYAFSFEAKILFVNRCICAFQSLNSSNRNLLGYNLKNWTNCNESCNITQIAVKKSNKIFLVKRWDFWTCSLITKGGERKSTPTVKNLNFEESCFVPNDFLCKWCLKFSIFFTKLNFNIIIFMTVIWILAKKRKKKTLKFWKPWIWRKNFDFFLC